MRRIKFKAKDRNGKWLYGGIVQAHYDSGVEVCIVSEQDLAIVCVRPESVCQFTGLKDKNGIDIYEGDIVRWDDRSDGKYWRFAVVKYAPDLCFDCKDIAEFCGVKNSTDHCFHYSRFAYSSTDLEIVGNINEKGGWR